MHKKIYQYSDLTSLTRWLGLSLVVCILSSLFAFFFEGFLFFQFVSMKGQGLAQTDLWVNVEGTTIYLQGSVFVRNIFFFVAAILSLKWIYRAFTNAKSFGGIESRFSPNTAVLSFVVPLINLCAPFGVVKELWGISSYFSGNTFLHKRSYLPTAWWASYLVTICLFYLSYLGGLKSATPVDLAVGHLTACAFNLSFIVLSLCFLKLTGQVLLNQTLAYGETVSVEACQIEEQGVLAA